MKVVYKPEGAKKPRKWDFDPDKMMSPEMEAIERLTGLDYLEWVNKFPSSMLAVHGFLYVMLKRENPTLKFDEVKFSLSMLDFELDDEETAARIASLEQKAVESELSESEEQILIELRAQVSEGSGPKADD